MLEKEFGELRSVIERKDILGACIVMHGFFNAGVPPEMANVALNYYKTGAGNESFAHLLFKICDVFFSGARCAAPSHFLGTGEYALDLIRIISSEPNFKRAQLSVRHVDHHNGALILLDIDGEKFTKAFELALAPYRLKILHQGLEPLVAKAMDAVEDASLLSYVWGQQVLGYHKKMKLWLEGKLPKRPPCTGIEDALRIALYRAGVESSSYHFMSSFSDYALDVVQGFAYVSTLGMTSLTKRHVVRSDVERNTCYTVLTKALELLLEEESACLPD